jgi:hydrophobic/amphiphilic exporter-1 (mainly G- bacteria), HAE1 family
MNILPFSVLLAVPLGVFGAILSLTLHCSLSNNIYVQFGLVTLIGLAAKNSIFIVPVLFVMITRLTFGKKKIGKIKIRAAWSAG